MKSILLFEITLIVWAFDRRLRLSQKLDVVLEDESSNN